MPAKRRLYFDHSRGTTTKRALVSALATHDYQKRQRYRKYRRNAPLRTFARARKKFPASEYGYQFIPRNAGTANMYGRTYFEADEDQRKAREAARYYGQGKYGLLKKAWKVAKPYALMGARKVAHHYLGTGMYTGQGSYHSNELVDGANSDMIPTFASKDDETGELTLTHREYVGEVYANEAGNAFENRSYHLNPGLEETFPWLSQIAQNFEEYDFKQLMFTYRSTVADVSSANGQVGTVIMATQYNPSRPAFKDKGEMIEYSAASSGKTTEGAVHGVECDNEKLAGSDSKYVRASHLEQREDIKEYDHGIFQLATANTPTAFKDNSIGELWVSYTIVLRKPKLFSGRGNGITRLLLHTAVGRGLAQSNNTVPSDHRFPCAVTDSVGIASQSSFTPKVERDSGHWKIILPGNIAGVFRVTVRVRGNTSETSGSIQMAPPYLAGNIVPVYSYLTGGASPHSDAINKDEPEWYSTTTTNLVTASVHCLHLEFTVRISPASNNVNNALVWSAFSPASANGEVSYYYGAGSGSDGGPFQGEPNNTAYLFELSQTDVNTEPTGQIDVSAMTIEMTEIGTTLTQERVGLDYPELIDISTGALMPPV